MDSLLLEHFQDIQNITQAKERYLLQDIKIVNGIIPEIFYTMVGEITNLQNTHKCGIKEFIIHHLL
jgi:hypothetical protein